MEINKAISRVLRESNIEVQGGTLVLLGIYYGVDVDIVCPEEIVKAISTSKIVEKDYKTNTIKWNIPLFIGQETEWDWVINGYNSIWNKYPSRKDSDIDVLKRMKRFFSLYPQYRKQDVKNAVTAYIKTIRDPQYIKSSAKFIFEGIGAMQKSMLLKWCEDTSKDNSSHQIGNIVK